MLTRQTRYSRNPGVPGPVGVLLPEGLALPGQHPAPVEESHHALGMSQTSEDHAGRILLDGD
jgi:hypothetical protein